MRKVDMERTLSSILQDKIIRQCSAEAVLKAKAACYTGHIRLVASRYGLRMSLLTLTSAQKHEPLLYNCHLLAHYLSRDLYMKGSSNIREILNSIDLRLCGSGLLHGVIESYLNAHNIQKVNVDVAKTLCDGYDDRYRIATCYHFIGHILTLQTRDDIPYALRECNQLTREFIRECYNGVFMEHHQKVMLSDHLIVAKPLETVEYARELGKKCNTYSGIISEMCWMEIAEIYGHATQYDQKTLWDGCSEAHSPVAAKECYGKAIGIMSVYAGNTKPENLKKICSPYIHLTTDYRECLHNIIMTLVHYSPTLVTKGIDLCSNVHPMHRKICFRELGFGYVYYTKRPDVVLATCSKVPKEYQQVYCSEAES